MSEALLKEIHKGLKRCRPGDVVYDYLTGKGITTIPDNIYIHPSLKLYDTVDNKQIIRGFLPAMVIPFRDVWNKLVAYREMFLPSEKIRYVGILNGASAHFGEVDKELVVSVGIVEGLLFRERSGMPVWCAGTEENMTIMEIPKSVTDIKILAGDKYKEKAAAYGFATSLHNITVTVINQTRVDGKLIDVHDSGDGFELVDFYNKNW